MAKYREKECYNCGIVLPSNEMIKRKIRVEIGQTSASQSEWESKPKHALSSKGGYTRQLDRTRVGHSYQTGKIYYRTQEKWFCKECFENYKEPENITNRLRSGSVSGSPARQLGYALGSAIRGLFKSK